MFVSPPVFVQHQSAAERHLHYEPAVVRLQGRVIQQAFHGPPNFQSDAVSSVERCWILELDEPVFVSPASISEDGLNNASYSHVRQIQLVFSHPELISSLKNEAKGVRVTASGTLFEAHTGHHHTDVLMTVESISIAKWHP